MYTHEILKHDTHVINVINGDSKPQTYKHKGRIMYTHEILKHDTHVINVINMLSTLLLVYYASVYPPLPHNTVQ